MQNEAYDEAAEIDRLVNEGGRCLEDYSGPAVAGELRTYRDVGAGAIFAAREAPHRRCLKLAMAGGMFGACLETGVLVHFDLDAECVEYPRPSETPW